MQKYAENLVRLAYDAAAEHPYTVEVNNDVEGWKTIAWGKKKEGSEAIILSVQVALRKAYNMGTADVLGSREEWP